jgi:hypothetical protein
MDSKLPKSLVYLYNEWTSRDFARFLGMCRKSWPGKTRQAFTKREYLFKAIEEKADHDMTNVKQAAAALDAKRVSDGMTVGTFYTHIKKVDTTVVRRNRRPRDDDDEVEVWQAPAPARPRAPAARKRQRGHCPPHPSAPPGFIPGGHPGNRGNPFPMMNGNHPMPWGGQNVVWENTGRTSGHRGMGDL